MPPSPYLHHVALTMTISTVRPRGTDGCCACRSRSDVTGRAGAGCCCEATTCWCRGRSTTARRAGIDHLAIGCRTRDDLDAWIAHLDALEVPHAKVTEAPHAHLVACHDPDGIAVEFYWLTS
jgi:catechol 2,3-dioxygenase-like lactoylglutathione lyase family enzyme